MRLLSLDLEGFKSFADKTHIEFDNGITCVVGANGNGKTCILDAILWVLGTQSNTELRTNRKDGMGALIFRGSEKRNRSNFAQVSVVFSNDRRELNIDTSTVEIRRKVTIINYRSDDDFDTSSEYFINRQQVRLRDINTLLADTGIGKNSYSILPQKETDRILSMDPLKRRDMIEEAASITRYRMEEREAQARLLAAEQNCKEVNIRFNELQKQYNKLKTQAEAVKGYNRDIKELHELENKQDLIELLNYENNRDDIQMKLDKSREKLKVLEQRSKNFEQKKSENEAILSTLREELGILESEIQSSQGILKSREDLLGDFVNNRVNLQASYDDIADRFNQVKDEEKNIAKVKQDLELAIQKNTSEFKKISEALSKEKEKYDTYNSKLKESENLKSQQERQKRELELELFDTYSQFVSTAHDVISLVYNEIKDNENVKIREKIEKDILAKILQLKNIIGSRDVVDGNDLLQVRTIVDEILDFFEKYKQSNIDFSKLKKDFKSIEDAKKNDDVVSGIFDKIKNIDDDMEGSRKNIGNLVISREKSASIIDDLRVKLQNVDKELAGLKAKSESTLKDFENIKIRMEQTARDVESAKKFLDDNVSQSKAIEKEIDNLKKTFDNKCKEKDIKEKKKEKIQSELISIGEKDKVDIDELRTSIVQLEAKLEGAQEFVKAKSEAYFEKENLSIQDLKNTVKLGQKDDLQTIKRNIKNLRDQIKSYGNINYLAAEEFDDIKKQYDLVKAQLEDYNTAKEEIKDIVVKIQTSCEDSFNDTFEQVKNNFATFYSALTRGGIANLLLEEVDEGERQGVIMSATPPGKKVANVMSLSGGEKDMVGLAFFFAIFKTKPSPFCFLDEPDAALSENNVTAFLNMLGDFKDFSQFIMITHNRYTLKGGNSLLGVVQRERGVSSVLSLKMNVTDDGKFILTDKKTGRNVDIPDLNE